VRFRTSRIVTICAVSALGIGVFAGGAFAAQSKLALKTSGFAFNKPALTAKPGTVSITLTNLESLGHNVAIKKGSKIIKKGPVVGKGKKSIVTTILKKGSYTFYCSVAGHEPLMHGTLTVK